MKRIRISIVAAAGLLAWTGTAAAQATAAGLLNKLEVQKAVTRPAPGDYEALSAHFAALADRYDAEATRHTTLARTGRATSNRDVAITAELHHKWLADRNRESAAIVRALARHHERLAAGEDSIAPAGAARFEGGDGARRPSRADLSTLAARAVTPADHYELEEYYLGLAREHTSEAEAHRLMAMSYRGTRAAQASDHCERLMRESRKAAGEALEAAARHRQLAGIGE